MTPTELIEKTWKEVGFRVRPLARKVFIRTEQRPWKTKGGVWLPPSSTLIYAADRSKIDVELYARVCSVGPQVREIKVGDRIFFSRLYFAWIRKLDDGQYLGYLDELNVFGLAAEDAVKEEEQVEKFRASSSDERPRASLR